MKKFLLALSAVGLIIIFSSASFAYSEEEARDALITYSGTEAFANLLPEERRACMLWVSEGGYMSELCRSAVTRLVSDDPNAVTLSQRKALLAAAAGRTSSTASRPAPAQSSGTVIVKEQDNTGPIIAAGIVGVIAGMVIHNNLPRDRDRGRTVYCPAPRYRPAPPHYRPAPPIHRPAPHYKVETHYRVEPHYHVHINKPTVMRPHSPVRHAPIHRAPARGRGPCR